MSSYFVDSNNESDTKSSVKTILPMHSQSETTDLKKMKGRSSADTIAGTIFMNKLYSRNTSPHASEIDSRLHHLGRSSYKTFSGDWNFNKKYPSFNQDILTDGEKNIFLWNRHFPGTEVLETAETATAYNRFVCSFDIYETFTTVFDALRNNLFVFIIELFRGPTEETHRLLLELRMTKHFLSRAINNPIQYSALAAITSRYPKTGLLRKRIHSIKLNENDKIIVTADRKFAQKGTKNVIYINCLGTIKKLQPCDYILIGNDIRLKVVEQINISAMCTVRCGGILERSTSVIFPKEHCMDINTVTPEEIEDITFSHNDKVNCIILPTCDCDIYFNSIKKLLNSLNFNYCRIFATVYAEDIKSMEQATLIAENYDGLQLYLFKTYSETLYQLIQLSDPVKHLIERFYFQKKPILVGQFFVSDILEEQTIAIHPDSQKHILYYPDKFVLKVTQLKYYFVSSYFKLVDSSKYSMVEYSLGDLTMPLEKYLLSDSNIFARSVVQTAYNCNAKCIILSSNSGRMAIKVSHFRPNIPIIVLTENLNIVRSLSIFNNVWMVYYNSYKENNAFTLSLKKLLCAVIYAVSHSILMEGNNLVFLYKYNTAGAFANKMAVLALSATLLENIAIKSHSK